MEPYTHHFVMQFPNGHDGGGNDAPSPSHSGTGEVISMRVPQVSRLWRSGTNGACNLLGHQRSRSWERRTENNQLDL